MNNLPTLSQVIRSVSIISMSFMILVYILNMFSFGGEGFIPEYSKWFFLYEYRKWIYLFVITLNLTFLITKERQFILGIFKAPMYLSLGLYMTVLMIGHYINPYLTPDKYSFEFFFWTSLFLIMLFAIYTNEKRNIVMSICFSITPIVGLVCFLFY